METGTRFNIEVKARCADLDAARRTLLEAGAVSHGIDAQTDTYFVSPRGRLKVRQGRIETALIAYDRPDSVHPKPSSIQLAPLSPEAASQVLIILERILPLRVRVVKEREILFLGTVKFHLDRVEGLGTFIEIEAISKDGVPDQATLEDQAAQWRVQLGIAHADLIATSYADMLTHG